MYSKPVKIILLLLVCLFIGLRIYDWYRKKQLNENANSLLETAQNALFYEKDTVKALSLYEEFLNLKPDFLPVYRDLLPVYQRKGDSAKTIEYRLKIEKLTEPYVPTI